MPRYLLMACATAPILDDCFDAHLAVADVITRHAHVVFVSDVAHPALRLLLLLAKQ